MLTNNFSAINEALVIVSHYELGKLMKKLLISSLVIMLNCTFVYANEKSVKATISTIQSYPEYGN